MHSVQFDSQDVDATHQDLSVLGIDHELIRPKGRCHYGIVVAAYDERTAPKLREYLESHHCSETPEHVVSVRPVDGWEDLVEAATLH